MTPEEAVKGIVYAMAGRDEGSRCNIYGCTRHDHPEVEKVRQFISSAIREAVRDEHVKWHEEQERAADKRAVDHACHYDHEAAASARGQAYARELSAAQHKGEK